MATFYSRETRLKGDNPPRPVGNASLYQRDRISRATIPLDVPPLNSTTNGTGIASGDIVSLFRIPAGCRFVGGKITSSVSLGTSTIAIGTAGNPTLYRAAGTFTAADTPTSFGTAAGFAAGELQADQEIILTVAAANLPTTAGAFLVVDMTFSAP